MNVVGVYLIDFHVDALLISVLRKPAGYTCGSRFVQELFAIQSSPNQADPTAGIRMSGHRLDRKSLKRLMSIFR
jgi:hypothetical protein